MISHLDFLDFYPAATHDEYMHTMTVMALCGIDNNLRAAAFFSIMPRDLSTVDEVATKWMMKDLNEAADCADRAKLRKVFKRSPDAMALLHDLRVYSRVLEAW